MSDIKLGEYRLTFGCQYGPGKPRTRVQHPLWAPADADGWVTIMAPDMGCARACAVRLFGQAWSNVYPPGAHTDADDARFYPRGELARIHHFDQYLPEYYIQVATS